MSKKATNVIGTKRRVEMRQDTAKLKSLIPTDTKLEHAAALNRRVSYRMTRMGKGRYTAEIVGPFFSRMYGYGATRTTPARAKEALQQVLLKQFGYIGRMVKSDTDDADNVGLSISERWRRANNEERAKMRRLSSQPITHRDAVGSAGQ